jgi:hypothetical protein
MSMVKVKGTVLTVLLFLTEHHDMKANWRSGGIAPHILRARHFTPRLLYSQGKSPWYPLDRRLGGPQSRAGRGGEEENSQPTPGIEPYNPNRPVRRLCQWVKKKV